MKGRTVVGCGGGKHVRVGGCLGGREGVERRSGGKEVRE